MNPPTQNSHKISNLKRGYQVQFQARKSLVKTIIFNHKCKIFEVLIATILTQMLSFSVSIALKNVITELTDEERLKNDNINLTSIGINFAAIVVIIVICDLLESYYMYTWMNLAYMIKSAILSLIAEKVINFNCALSQIHTEGNIANYIQVDALKLE